MNASVQAGPQEVLREAAARLARAHAAGVRPEDDLALSAWRRESHAHESAFRHAMDTWEGARALRTAPAYDDLMGPPTWRERWVAARARWRDARAPAWMRAGAMACTVVLSVVALGAYFALRGPDYQTQVAETRELRLDDGSVVMLGARSALDIEFTSSDRRVRLQGGEAFFSIAKDPGRPFVVVAGDTLVRVVGTRFNVNLDQARARVVVEEGVVEVLRTQASAADEVPGHGPPPLRLTAGQQVLVKPGLPLPLAAEPLRGAEPGAWRQGRLSYRDATLAEVVADANRYRTAPIRIAAAELEDSRITTSFRTGQIEQMLDTLPDTLPLAVRRRSDGSVDLEPRAPFR